MSKISYKLDQVITDYFSENSSDPKKSISKILPNDQTLQSNPSSFFFPDLQVKFLKFLKK